MLIVFCGAMTASLTLQFTRDSSFIRKAFPELDSIAVERCIGRVLDIGAGAGSHSLAIQERGLEVTSVDVSEKAVEVMRRRGCKNAKVGDVFDSYSELFDTVLVILNIGIVQKS